jgi:hypothetical protein
LIGRWERREDLKRRERWEERIDRSEEEQN